MNRKSQIIGSFPGVALAFGRADEGTDETGSAQYFGVFDEESGSTVDSETLFPACSVSKFVTAICVMKLQESGLADIDEKANRYLKRWKLLTLDEEESDATVRAILSHTAGIVDGEDSFYGLRIGDPEVSLLDILEGRTRYNDRPVRAEKPQGAEFVYSDAGYCVLQLMIEDITGKEYSDFLKETIFDRLGLDNSFFASPAEREKHRLKMATGYDEDGLPIPGKYPVTPDLAASGLWSNPEDLRSLAAEFFRALNGKSTFLRADSAHEIIRPADAFSQAGLGVFMDGKDTLISKGWGENGQCMMKLNMHTGEISVVMTNKNPGVDQAGSGIEWLTDSFVYFI